MLSLNRGVRSGRFGCTTCTTIIGDAGNLRDCGLQLYRTMLQTCIVMCNDGLDRACHMRVKLGYCCSRYEYCIPLRLLQLLQLSYNSLMLPWKLCSY